MSFVETLRTSRRASVAAILQFMLRYQETSADVHAFMEGRDDPAFYLGFLSSAVDDIGKIHVYQCENKRGVYEAFSKISRINNRPPLVLFFVDKDHSDFVGEAYVSAPNIFVTDTYSIENYVVSDEVLRRVWEELLAGARQGIDFAMIASKFQQELVRFYELATPLSAWIVLARRNGLSPQVNNIRPGDLFAFNEEMVVSYVGKETLLDYFQRSCRVVVTQSLADAFDKTCNELGQVHPKKHVRGKLELWFFVRFILGMLKLIEVSQDGRTAPRLRIAFGDENAMDVLGPRTRMPDTLREFFVLNGLISSQ